MVVLGLVRVPEGEASLVEDSGDDDELEVKDIVVTVFNVDEVEEDVVGAVTTVDDVWLIEVEVLSEVDGMVERELGARDTLVEALADVE